MEKYTLDWLLSHTEVVGDCLVWTRAKDKDGYGQSGPFARKFKVHREVAKLCGHNITGKVVTHSCDNPSCINPDHLGTGTPTSNMIERGERARTHNHVSEEERAEVHKLRADGLTHLKISQQLNIKIKRVEYILRA